MNLIEIFILCVVGLVALLEICTCPWEAGACDLELLPPAKCREHSRNR